MLLHNWNKCDKPEAEILYRCNHEFACCRINLPFFCFFISLNALFLFLFCIKCFCLGSVKTFLFSLKCMSWGFSSVMHYLLYLFVQEQKHCLCPEGTNSHIHACKKQKDRACLLHCFNGKIHKKEEWEATMLDVIFHCCEAAFAWRGNVVMSLQCWDIKASCLLYNFYALSGKICGCAETNFCFLFCPHRRR